MQTENTQTQSTADLQQTRAFQSGSPQPRALNPNQLDSPVILSVEGAPQPPVTNPVNGASNQPYILGGLVSLMLLLLIALAAIMLNWEQPNKHKVETSTENAKIKKDRSKKQTRRHKNRRARR